jgi:hypothetical protein
MVGMFGAAAIGSFLKSVVSLGSEIFHSAQQAQIGVESFQALEIMFKEAGSNGARLNQVLTRIRTSQARAASGEKTQADAWERIGIQLKDIQGIGADRVLDMISKKSIEAGDSAEFMRGLYDIMGTRSIPVLTEVMQQLGKRGLDPTIDRFKELNLIMSSETAAALAVTEDQLARVGRTIKTTFADGLLLVVDFMRAFTAAQAAIVREEGGGIGGFLATLNPVRVADEFGKAFQTIERDRRGAINKEIERRQKLIETLKNGEADITSEVEKRADIAARATSKATGRRRIGGFGGGGQDRLLDVGRMQVRLNTQRNAILEAMRNDMRKFQSEIGKLPE